MDKKFNLLIIFAFFSQLSYAGPEQAPMAVWVNEAIVATYSFDYKNYLQDQKQIAQYFTANGWMAYSKALNESKLPEAVQKTVIPSVQWPLNHQSFKPLIPITGKQR